MTVEELIEQLKYMPKDAPVFKVVHVDAEYFTHITKETPKFYFNGQYVEIT